MDENERPWTLEELKGAARAVAWCKAASVLGWARLALPDRHGLAPAARWLLARQGRCLAETLAALMWIHARRGPDPAVCPSCGVMQGETFDASNHRPTCARRAGARP